MKHMSAQHVVESLAMGYYGSLGNWSIDTYRYLLMRDADKVIQTTKQSSCTCSPL